MKRRTENHQRRVAKRIKRATVINHKAGPRACSVCHEVFVNQAALEAHVPCVLGEFQLPVSVCINCE